VEIAIAQFGQEEQARLAKEMPHRKITLCEDETFHPEVCLVAIEPVSNYLILEVYADNRDASTWNAAISEALKPFSVTVIQCCSDLAPALISHAVVFLGIHHSPDLFHVQHDTCKATSAPLHRQTAKAEKVFKVADDLYQQAARQLEDFQGNWPNSIQQIAQVQKLESEISNLEEVRNNARNEFETVQSRQHRARDARLGIGLNYHPFDVTTGAPRKASEVESSLAGHFDTLDQVAAEANLGQSSFARLAKARRVLPALIETIRFFWTLISSHAQDLSKQFSSEVVRVWWNELVAGCYLALVAERCKDSNERKRLRELSSSILERAKARDGPLKELSEEQKDHLVAQARIAAEWFQRSSSCVEGRNGQLSLRHHGLREITKRKLCVLGVLHNFVIKRRDGSTAASRFFGQKPRELFPWLVEHMPLPSRPRRRRTKIL
jgi:Family of unknown function (DUF6399)